MAEVVVATEDSALSAILDAELSSMSFQVFWALDGYETLDACSSRAPLAVLIDAVIGGFSLWELCSLLRERPEVPSGLPIFLVSDEDLPSRKLQAYRIAEVLPKAHDTARLRELLYDHVDLAQS